MQTSYSINQPIGIEGSLADSGVTDKLSFATTVAIPFGRLATRVSGTDSNAKLPVQATDITTATNIAGVSIADQARESDEDGIDPGYKSNQMAALLNSGRIYVKVEEAVTPASTPHVRFSGKAQIQDLTFSAALITANVINGDINGSAITPITFATSNAATLTALAAAIQTHPEVETAVSDGTDTITITGVIDKSVLIANFVVTGGVSQATASVTQSQALILTTKRGSFRASTDNSTAAALPNSKFRTTASAGELAVLEVKF